jgi:hypothetical protein
MDKEIRRPTLLWIRLHRAINSLPQPTSFIWTERGSEMLVILIIVIALVLGGGGGYYGYGRWGRGGGAGIGLGTVLVILLVCYLLGVFR